MWTNPVLLKYESQKGLCLLKTNLQNQKIQSTIFVKSKLFLFLPQISHEFWKKRYTSLGFFFYFVPSIRLGKKKHYIFYINMKKLNLFFFSRWSFYMFNQIRPHLQDYEKDIICPSPDEEWQLSYYIVLHRIICILCILLQCICIWKTTKIAHWVTLT